MGVRVFILVVYFFNMMYLILQLLYQIWQICPFWYNFDTVLCQFLETGTSDRCLQWYRSKAENLSFHPIPPFIFPLLSL